MIKRRLLAGSFLALAAVLWLSAQALAQSASSPVVTGDMARRLLTKNEISAEAAEKIGKVYLDFAKKHNYVGTVFILDPFGAIVYAQRMDGAQPVQIDGAITKARTALHYRTTTHELANRIAKNPGEQIGFWLEEFHPTPGGVPIVLNGVLIGVLGVTGSDALDEEGAYSALHQVLGIPMPSADHLKWDVPPPGQQAQPAPAR
jgi:uncharacterized protein GlcG (DUF336 family)